MVSWSAVLLIAFFAAAALAFAALPSQLLRPASSFAGVSGFWFASSGGDLAFSSFVLLLVIASFVFYFSERY